MTTPKRALTSDDLGGHGGEKEPENLQKKFQDEINPVREDQTFTLEQMKAYAEAARLGFQISFPAGKKEESQTKVIEEKSKSLSSPYVAPTPSQTDVTRLEAANKCVLPNLKADSIRKWGLAVQGYEMTHGFYERRLISKRGEGHHQLEMDIRNLP